MSELTIHISIELSNIDEFKTDLKHTFERNPSVIILIINSEITIEFINQINISIKHYQGEVYLQMDDHFKQNNQIECDGIITTSPELIESISKMKPNVKIGVITDEIVDCKNAEYLGADFVYLGPFFKIGLAPYLDISPIKPIYEWMILNITIPIFAFGFTKHDDFNLLLDQIKLGGLRFNQKNKDLLEDMDQNL